jgi:hypothetical protein
MLTYGKLREVRVSTHISTSCEYLALLFTSTL